MESEKKKDALTELIDMAGSQTSKPSNNGTVSTPTGEMVELGFTLHIQKVAKKVLEIIKMNKEQNREALEQMVKKNQKHYEREKTN